MRINKPDDKLHNTLVFNEHEKKFIFNAYKTAKKSKPQTIPIEDPTLIHVLDDYLKHHVKRGQEYLLERNGRPLDKKDIMNIMRDEIGKKFEIPTGIRRLRHLFTSFVVVDKPVDLRLLQDIAYKMGTSDTVMIRNYADFKKAVDTGED